MDGQGLRWHRASERESVHAPGAETQMKSARPPDLPLVRVERGQADDQAKLTGRASTHYPQGIGRENAKAVRANEQHPTAAPQISPNAIHKARRNMLRATPITPPSFL